MLYYTILYYTILYYTILYYTILYYSILYYLGVGRSRRICPGIPRRWPRVYARCALQGGYDYTNNGVRGSSLLGGLDDGDEAPGHGSHDDGGDQRCLCAIDRVTEVGCHTTKAEEEDAGAEEQNLQEGGRLSAVGLGTGPQTNADTEVGEVTREVRRADGQGAASSGDAILDALREGPQQQGLRGSVVAHAALRFAVVDQAAKGHGEGCGQQVRRVASLVDGLLVALAEARHEGSPGEGHHEMKEFGAPVHDQSLGLQSLGPRGATKCKSCAEQSMEESRSSKM